MHSFTFQSQSQKMKEIPKSSIQLNLNYQLIYLIKSMHCITKEPNNQNESKKIFFFLRFSLSENPSSLSENPSRLSEIGLESIAAPSSFSPGRPYSRLGENTFSQGRNTSRLGEIGPENTSQVSK